MAGPFDFLVLSPVPARVELWALTEVPLTAQTYSDVVALRVPNLPPGVVRWDPTQDVIEGVQVVRSYAVEFGPLPPDESGAGVGGLAVADVEGAAILSLVAAQGGDYYLGPYPATLIVEGTAIMVRRGEAS